MTTTETTPDPFDDDWSDMEGRYVRLPPDAHPVLTRAWSDSTATLMHLHELLVQAVDELGKALDFHDDRGCEIADAVHLIEGANALLDVVKNSPDYRAHFTNRYEFLYERTHRGEDQPPTSFREAGLPFAGER